MSSLHPLDEIVGPFHDVVVAAARWGISAQEMREKVAGKSVIACSDQEGRLVFPVWQFAGADGVYSEMVTVWAMLADASDEWTAALWMRGAQGRLDGGAATAWLAAGRPLASVLDAAREDIERWAH